MSGVYIKMEMPKTCKQCLFSRYILGEWFCRTTTTLDEAGEELWESVGKFGNLHRPRWCPLISVPAHGDLISREWLIDIALHLLNTAKNDDIANGVKWLWQYIIEAPTIIPAEEGE